MARFMRYSLVVTAFALTTIPVKAGAIRTTDFDTDPGWVAVGSGTNQNDFGYRPSAFAGQPGEAGGRFTRSSFERYYGDTALGGSLSLAVSLHGAGLFDTTGFNSPDFGPGVILGHFDTTSSAAIGLIFNNTPSGGLYADARRVADTQYQQNRELLDVLMGAVASIGRLPEPDEFPEAPAIVEKFGSLRRAFAVVRHITGDDEWEQIAKRRTEDMLVYLALARFRRRPAISLLPRDLQLDIKAFFGTYSKACSQADDLLFQAGNAELIDAACKRSTIGKLLPDALYIHRESLDYLEPVLRVYEGCGRAYLGEVEGANLIKIHRYSGKVSYLVYPDFAKDPHPALDRSVKLCMRSRQLECYEFGQGGNPPILHRKESFLHSGHEFVEKFARLTKQEEKAGLLDDTASIGTKEGWTTRLAEKGLALRGHRLVKAPH